MSDTQEKARHEFDRIPFLVVFQEKSPFKDTYAGEVGRVVLTAHHLKPKSVARDTVVVFMHPIGGGAYLPMMSTLARSGVPVIWCDSRYRGTDSALIMEKVAVDLGACVRYAKEKLGYKNVVLGGWSGGGSLSLFYQAEAEAPSVTATPAGDLPDLTREHLTPADGVMLIAAHISRNVTLTEWMDASILDETDPGNRDGELDIYDPKNPNQPPYSGEFISRYRAAQIARNRRITAWVKDKLARLAASGFENDEYGFMVHGTMADPRWRDVTLDPNDRPANWCYLGDPRIVNMSPVGLARYSSLRSWLSQWSYDDSHADGLKSAARTSVPVLVLDNSADDACTPSHAKRLYEAIKHDRKKHVTVKGANHYYFGQPEKAQEAANVCCTWLESHGFIQ